MQKWTYRVVQIDMRTEGGIYGVERVLNALGADGWEVVSAELAASSYMVVLKRPVAP